MPLLFVKLSLRMKFAFFFLLCFLLLMSGFAQEFQISGTVTDGKIPLPDAIVRVEGKSCTVTQTDAAGNYSLSLNRATIPLSFPSEIKNV